jgi:hypothetical protein
MALYIVRVKDLIRGRAIVREAKGQDDDTFPPAHMAKGWTPNRTIDKPECWLKWGGSPEKSSYPICGRNGKVSRKGLIAARYRAISQKDDAIRAKAERLYKKYFGKG